MSHLERQVNRFCLKYEYEGPITYPVWLYVIVQIVCGCAYVYDRQRWNILYTKLLHPVIGKLNSHSSVTIVMKMQSQQTKKKWGGTDTHTCRTNADRGKTLHWFLLVYFYLLNSPSAKIFFYIHCCFTCLQREVTHVLIQPHRVKPWAGANWCSSINFGREQPVYNSWGIWQKKSS